MESCFVGEKKRSPVPVQGLQAVVREDPPSPSIITVLLSHSRNTPTARGEVLGGTTWLKW